MASGCGQPFSTASRNAAAAFSPDDKYLYLSCFVGSEIQAWDISDPEHIKRVQDVLQRVHDNGFVYEGMYEWHYLDRPPGVAPRRSGSPARAARTSGRAIWPALASRSPKL